MKSYKLSVNEKHDSERALKGCYCREIACLGQGNHALRYMGCQQKHIMWGGTRFLSPETSHPTSRGTPRAPLLVKADHVYSTPLAHAH